MVKEVDMSNDTKAIPECERCGKKDDSVETVINPYVKEVLGDETEITVCTECLEDIRKSI